MSKCANCGTELAPGMKFCCECGTPVPQVKVCPDCGSEQKPEAKFCSNCGHRFGAPAADGGAADMGLKIGHSTVMGDISNTVNHVTNVTNADETKHVVKCHVCGKVLTVVGTHECPMCHENVCDEHFDLARKMCTACVERVQKEGEAAFRQAIREELKAGGGRITQEAFGRLRQKRTALGLDEARGREFIAAERRAEAPADGTVLTDVQRRFLEKAKRLVFNDGKCAEGVAEIDRILAGGVVQSDEILAVLLPALLGCDEKRGDSIAQSVLADSLPVALYRVDRALRHSDWPEADRKLVAAEQIWPDDVQVRCRRVALLCAMGRELGDDDLYEQARAVRREIGETTDKLERSWLSYVTCLMPGGAAVASSDDDLYATILSGVLTGLAVGRPWWADETTARVRKLWNDFLIFKNDSAKRKSVVELICREDPKHPSVQYLMGELCELSLLGEEKIPQARSWFEAAACAGHYEAAKRLGMRFRRGERIFGYEKDEKLSRQWYAKAYANAECAARAGDAVAMFELGSMYRFGSNFESKEDPKLGVFWWAKAAERGHAEAQYELARAYENGEGVCVDITKAVELTRASAEGGYWRGLKTLGRFYEDGVPGVLEADGKEALKLYRRCLELRPDKKMLVEDAINRLSGRV